MKINHALLALGLGLILAVNGYAATLNEGDEKYRILVISSYHNEYLWSQETNQGFCAAMLKYGYFDNKDQADVYTKNDYVESTKAVVKKMWMDSKRKKGKQEKAEMAMRVTQAARDFEPDIIFLGDDNAVKYIGNQFFETGIPIVFWGVNNTPVKYGLVVTKDRPGHNVTGVYQTGYYVESLLFLKKIVPEVKTFAILSDDTSSGRSHLKKIQYYANKGELPLTLTETVSTKDYSLWKKKAMELQNSVDAFFLAQYSGLKDDKGNYVPTEEVTSWYMQNITVPEAAVQGQFVKQGMLCSADDSGYNQGFEAVAMGHDILVNGAKPATFATRTPQRGALMVNKKRAKILGITFVPEMGVEEFIE